MVTKLKIRLMAVAMLLISPPLILAVYMYAQFFHPFSKALKTFVKQYKYNTKEGGREVKRFYRIVFRAITTGEKQ